MVAESWMNPPPGVKCTTKVEDIISAKEGACDTESGYSWFMIDLPPTATEITSMCQSASCLVMFETIKPVAPSECVTKTGWYLYADLLNPILKGCENVTKPSTTGEAPYNGSSSSTTTTAPPASAATAAPGASATTLAPVWVTASPAATTATPAVDASTQIVNTALSRGTIIAILSASVVVLTTITGLVKFFYNRRHRNDGTGGQNGGGGSPANTPRKPASPQKTAYTRGGRYNNNDDDDNDW